MASIIINLAIMINPLYTSLMNEMLQYWSFNKIECIVTQRNLHTRTCQLVLCTQAESATAALGF